MENPELGINFNTQDKKRPFEKTSLRTFPYLIEDKPFASISEYVLQLGVADKSEKIILPVELGPIAEASLYAVSKCLELIVDEYKNKIIENPNESIIDITSAISHEPVHWLRIFALPSIHEAVKDLPMFKCFVEVMKESLLIMKHYRALEKVSHLQGNEESERQYSNLETPIDTCTEEDCLKIFKLLQKYIEEFKSDELSHFDAESYLADQKSKWRSVAEYNSQ